MLYSAGALLAAIAGLAVGFGIPAWEGGSARIDLKPSPQQTAAQAPEKSGTGLHKLVRHSEPKPVPALQFVDGNGAQKTLDDFRGKVVVLNFWATWCAPCKVEMPALDRLQAKLGGDDFTVLALSVDRAGMEKPREFFRNSEIKALDLYNDETGESAIKVEAGGLPVTLILDREGREVARLTGTAEWDAAEVIDALKGYIAARS